MVNTTSEVVVLLIGSIGRRRREGRYRRFRVLARPISRIPRSVQLFLFLSSFSVNTNFQTYRNHMFGVEYNTQKYVYDITA